MSDSRPVLLVHGLGSSFEQNWVKPGWVAALAGEERSVLPFALPGHSSPPPEKGQEEEVVQSLVEAAAAEGCVDAVGFSLGALLLLTSAVRRPQVFGRIALLGLGDVQLRARPVAATFERDTPLMRGVRLGARRAGHDLDRVITFAGRQFSPPAFAELTRVKQPVLLVLGEQDLVAPADELLAMLPDARLVRLPGVDHGATPSSLRGQAVVLDFLAARTV